MAAPATQFKVADINLAAFGRKEIELAENEMPGLIATREKVCKISPQSRFYTSRNKCFVKMHSRVISKVVVMSDAYSLEPS